MTTTRLQRVPFFRWLPTLLKAAEKQQLHRQVVQASLKPEYLPDEARYRLETVVDWGRDAETLVRVDDPEILYLVRG